nr:MAG TPA: hypothetical protein [Inoviridae sp.]
MSLKMLIKVIRYFQADANIIPGSEVICGEKK